mmetsp:Transcript_146586/g.207914  ORF Transcript_146586/g.207914 Transcript_146586/m.207914 type:complete len:85 (-) Transcript_146586:2159-2413(-)
MKPSETQNPKHISVASGITVPLPSAPAQDALKKAILIEVFPLSESQGRFGAPDSLNDVLLTMPLPLGHSLVQILQVLVQTTPCS